MKIRTLGQVFLLGFSLCLGCTANPPSLQKVNSLGKITIGQLLPKYSEVSASGRAMGPRPSKGKFLIHLLHPELPTLCVDEECGEIGTLVQNYGGQLYGGSELKWIYGVFDILPPRNSSKKITEYGVLIVSDTSGKVILIYNHAKQDSVPIVLENLQKP